MSEGKQTNPLFSAAEKLRTELDRWLDVALTQGEIALDRFGLRPGSSHWSPAADIVEQSDRVVVLMDVPGVAAEDIDIAISGNVLSVAGRRSAIQGSETQPVRLRERPSGEFRRTLNLPCVVDADRAQAELRSGILKIVLPKSADAVPKKVPVTAVPVGDATTGTTTAGTPQPPGGP